MLRRPLFLIIFVLIFSVHVAAAQPRNLPYNMASPVTTAFYVSLMGSDSNPGTAEHPFATITAAWEQIPRATELTTGYTINILPGTYPPEALPNYWESRYGSLEYPIIIKASAGVNTVFLPAVNIYDTRYLYLYGLNFTSEFDPFHCERCDNLLLKGNVFTGADPETYNTQETVKINQSQYVTVEDNDISGAWDNAVDLVAVQYGYFMNNHIHNAGDWCMYLKGGSAYFYVSGNEFDDCGTGGFTAGQGTGFQYMTEPWTQYEAYDIKFVGNLIHDVQGAGIGVHGGYNILIAENNIYHVGERSHLLEIGFGERSCDGQPSDPARDNCDLFHANGGWGDNAIADGSNFVRIPNRNVFIYNNIIYNPSGTQSAYQHFMIFAPYSGPEQASGGVPTPTLADDNLSIQGNIIWNGDASMPLGVEDGFDAGCQASNPTCNIAQLTTTNFINATEPLLASGSSEVLNRDAFPRVQIPDFTWDVSAPQGDVSNQAVNILATAGGGISINPPLDTLAETTPVIEPPLIGAVLPSGPITVVTLGDSLTEGAGDEQERGGYPGRLIELIQTLRPDSTLLNLGHSGWNSDALINGDQGLPSELSEAVNAIQAATSNGQPALALVWIGSNDLFYLYEYGDPDAAAEQADLEHFGANLDTILSGLTGAGAQVVIAQLDDQSLRPVTQAGLAFPGTTKAEVVLMSAQITRYNQTIAEKAAQYGALLVDFYPTTIFTDTATLDYDGNHPNAAGYDIIAGMWFSVIEGILK